MTSQFLSLSLFFAASICQFSQAFDAAEVARLHPVLAQTVGEFTHPTDIFSPLFIDERRDGQGLSERQDQTGDLTYRNSRFDTEALSLAARDIRQSSEESDTLFDGAFNVVESVFRALRDSKQTIDRFSYTAIYQCLAVHTPYVPTAPRLTSMGHFELVNALFVLVDSSVEDPERFRSFAYVEIDEDTGRPVFCGNSRIRASQILQQNITSFDKLINGIHEPIQIRCTIDGSFSTCRHLFFQFGKFGGVSVRSSKVSQRTTIDWSQRAINASQVGTPALFLTNISLQTKTTLSESCSSACINAEEAINRQVAEDNPGPITRGTAIALILVPAVLSLVLTGLEVLLITTTPIVENKWGKWIIGALTLLDLGLLALAIIAAGIELPKMNEPLIYSSWYTVGNSALGEPVNVSSPMGDLQVEMLLLGEALSAQRSPSEARSVTIAGLVLSCLNVLILILAPLVHKCLK